MAVSIHWLCGVVLEGGKRGEKRKEAVTAEAQMASAAAENGKAVREITSAGACVTER